MACPYFRPERRIGPGGWNPAPRLPLGEAWGGTCCAPRIGPFEPREEIVRELCNIGYARGRCEYFPADAPIDAVRFSPAGYAQPSRGTMYILEKNHAPVEYGNVTELLAGREPLVSQAKAFLESLANRADLQSF